ncbi:hypothetical protein ACW4TU_30590 [Streptomyces sp. QTS52]
MQDDRAVTPADEEAGVAQTECLAALDPERAGQLADLLRELLAATDG